MPAGTRGTQLESRGRRSGASALYSLENPPSSNARHPVSKSTGRSTRQGRSAVRTNGGNSSSTNNAARKTRGSSTRRQSNGADKREDATTTDSTSGSATDDTESTSSQVQPRRTRSSARGGVSNSDTKASTTRTSAANGVKALNRGNNGSTRSTGADPGARRRPGTRKRGAAAETSSSDASVSSEVDEEDSAEEEVSSSSIPAPRSLRSRAAPAASTTPARKGAAGQGTRKGASGAGARNNTTTPAKNGPSKSVKIEEGADKTPVRRARRRGILSQLSIDMSESFPHSPGMSSPGWSEEIKTRSTRPRALDIEKKLQVVFPSHQDYDEVIEAVELDLHLAPNTELEGTLVEVSERNTSANACPEPTPDLKKTSIGDIIIPSIRIVKPPTDNRAPYVKQKSYHRAPEESQDYLDSRPCEYNIDTEDEAWLCKLNEVDSTLVSHDQFERWMERLENASYEAQQRRRDAWGCPRQHDIYEELIRKHREQTQPDSGRTAPSVQLLKEESERLTAELKAKDQPDPEYIAKHAPIDIMPSDDLNMLMNLPSRPSSGDGVNNANKDEIDIVCCVCYDGDSETSNQILMCDGCDIAVHQKCYGVSKIPNGDWFCSRCKAKTSTDIACVLCGQSDGAMKRTTCDRWAHVSCTLWLPEPCFLDGKTMEPVDKIKKIPAKNFGHPCTVCGNKDGVTMACASKGCTRKFHVTCGRKRGLAMKLCAYKGPNGEEVLTCAYCQYHTSAVLDAHTPDVSKYNVQYTFDQLKEVANWHYPRWRLSPDEAQQVLHDASMPLVQAMYRYWIYKRLTDMRGHPLLARLQVDEYGLRYSPAEDEKHKWRGRLRHERQQNLQSSYDMLTQLREDLERTRVLIDLVKKRERYKKALCNHRRALIEAEARFMCRYPREKLPTISRTQTLEEIHAILGLAPPMQRVPGSTVGGMGPGGNIIVNPYGVGNATAAGASLAASMASASASAAAAAAAAAAGGGGGSGNGGNTSGTKRGRKKAELIESTITRMEDHSEDESINVVDNSDDDDIDLRSHRRPRKNSVNSTGGNGTGTTVIDDTVVVRKHGRGGGVGRARRASQADLTEGESSSDTAEAPTRGRRSQALPPGAMPGPGSVPPRSPVSLRAGVRQAGILPVPPPPMAVTIPPLSTASAGLRAPDPPRSHTKHPNKRKATSNVGGPAEKRVRASNGNGNGKTRRHAATDSKSARHTRSREGVSQPMRKGDNCAVQ